MQIKDAESKFATLIHEHIWMQESKKPESTIVRNGNKHSSDAAAAKFKLQEETFAKELINWMFVVSHSQWLFYKAKRTIRLDRNYTSPPLYSTKRQKVLFERLLMKEHDTIDTQTLRL